MTRFEPKGATEFLRGRVVGLLQRSNRTCTTSWQTTATAITDHQPIDPIHCASIASDPRFTGTAKRSSQS